MGLGGLLFITGNSALRAADANANETRLREALRSALLQARTAENERAVLEAGNAELKQKQEVLTKRIEALAKQSQTTPTIEAKETMSSRSAIA